MNEPPYHRPVALEDGSALSIDKLVLDLTATRDWTDVEGALRSYFGSECVRPYGSGKGAAIGGYEMRWTIQVDADKSFFLGVNLRLKGRVESAKGRIEFCPNKLMSNERFSAFLRWLENAAKASDPVRFDLAQDFVVNPSRLLLVKNRKTLRTITASTTTYQLGRHNVPGFYRQYDKAVESNLVGPLTRCEMTCDANWRYLGVQRNIPRVIVLGEPGVVSADAAHINRETVVLARLMAADALEGRNVAVELCELDFRTSAKVVVLICARELNLFPESGVEKILDQVRGWRK